MCIKATIATVSLASLVDATRIGLFLFVLHHPQNPRQVQLMSQTYAFLWHTCQCNNCLKTVVLTMVKFATKMHIKATIATVSLASLGNATWIGLLLVGLHHQQKPRQVQLLCWSCTILKQTLLMKLLLNNGSVYTVKVWCKNEHISNGGCTFLGFQGWHNMDRITSNCVVSLTEPKASPVNVPDMCIFVTYFSSVIIA